MRTTSSMEEGTTSARTLPSHSRAEEALLDNSPRTGAAHAARRGTRLAGPAPCPRIWQACRLKETPAVTPHLRHPPLHVQLWLLLLLPAALITNANPLPLRPPSAACAHDVTTAAASLGLHLRPQVKRMAMCQTRGGQHGTLHTRQSRRARCVQGERVRRQYYVWRINAPDSSGHGANLRRLCHRWWVMRARGVVPRSPCCARTRTERNGHTRS